MSEPSLNFAQKGMKPASKLIVLSIACVVLIMLDSRYAAVQRAKGYVATALYPVQWLANQPVHFYRYVSGFMQSQVSLMADNKRLNEENGRLKLMLEQSKLQVRDLAELKKLQGLQEKGIRITGGAEIVSNGKDPLSDKLILNKGSTHGLRAGDAVIDGNGLMGQVTQVYPLNAELTLVTNGKTVIPVAVARTGVRSLLYGSGSAVSLRYFPADADLRAGDVLLTSGLDSVYPEGIPVAKIEQVSHAAGTPYYRVSLLPLAGFRSSKYVLVIPQQAGQAVPSEQAVPTSP